MTEFVVACAFMVLIAALFAWPVFKSSFASLTTSRWIVLTVVVLVISTIGAGIYITHLRSHNGWQPDGAADISEWIIKGRDSITRNRATEAVQAFEHAYDLSQGLNVEAITGLAEGLLMKRDPDDLDRITQLTAEALRLQPKNPNALWLSGLVAIHQKNLVQAREHFRTMLGLELSPRDRSAIEAAVRDMDEKLGEPGASLPAAPAGLDEGMGRSITVNVKLDEKLKSKLQSPTTLFILVRDPSQGGPPLAVQRHTTDELPLTIELTKANAMMPSRTIESADAVEVVARISRSGTPTQQSGDMMGSVPYSFSKQGAKGSVEIEINQQVP